MCLCQTAEIIGLITLMPAAAGISEVREPLSWWPCARRERYGAGRQPCTINMCKPMRLGQGSRLKRAPPQKCEFIKRPQCLAARQALGGQAERRVRGRSPRHRPSRWVQPSLIQQNVYNTLAPFLLHFFLRFPILSKPCNGLE